MRACTAFRLRSGIRKAVGGQLWRHRPLLVLEALVLARRWRKRAREGRRRRAGLRHGRRRHPRARRAPDRARRIGVKGVASTASGKGESRAAAAPYEEPDAKSDEDEREDDGDDDRGDVEAGLLALR